MDIQPLWDHPDPHLLRTAVQARHIDLMRHVNNVVYLQWLEDTAWDHSNALGLTQADCEACGQGLVVRQHTLSYLAPSVLGDVLHLGTWITQIDRLSLHRTFQFIREGDGRTVFRARTHYVCVDIAEGRARRMPPSFARAYSAALVPTAGSQPA